MDCWICGRNIEQVELPACVSCESDCKQKAYSAFINAGGSRGHFERWWPEVWRTSLRGHVVKELVRALTQRIREQH